MNVGIYREQMARGQVVLPPHFDGLVFERVDRWSRILPFKTPHGCGRKLRM